MRGPTSHPDGTCVAREIDDERVKLLYRRAPVALLTVLANAVILVWLLSTQVAASSLVLWAVTLLVFTAGRAGLLWIYATNADRFAPLRWENAFAVGSLLNGMAWGIGAAAFLGADLEYQVGVLFVVGGMVAGASSSCATSLRSFAAYTAPAAVPVIATLLSRPTAAHRVLGLTSLVFVAAMSWMAYRGGRVVVDSIRLRQENEGLANELTRRSRERAGRLQQLLDHAGVVTVVADPATSLVIDVSKNAEALFGAPDRALTGHPLVGACTLAALATADGWLELVAEARRGPTTTTGSLAPARGTLTSSGAGPRSEPGPPRRREERQVELTATIRAVFGVEYVLLVLKDITDRRLLETQLAQSHLLASLGTLSAGVAHEVNNPLAAVLTNLRFLRSTLPRRTACADAETLSMLVDPLDDAIEGAERIRQTVSNLLSTTRASNDPSAESDPQQVIEMLLRVADTEIRHRAEMVLDAEPTPNVRTDPVQLYQVILPLVLQATQAIADGGATKNRITVRLRYEPAGSAAPNGDPGVVRIEVEDSGPGMSPDQTARVFEPFFSTRPTGRGAGLSLSVCKKVIEEVGGAVDVESSPGHGTRFLVWLPASQALPAPRPAPASVTVARRILIVDDDAHVARALRRLLRAHDVTVEQVASVALDRLRAPCRYDAVLCDLMMPDMSGMDFYRAVARINPPLVPRIIFMTGGAFTEAASTFLATVDNRCLTKPFELSTLEEAVQAVAATPQPEPAG